MNKMKQTGLALAIACAMTLSACGQAADDSGMGGEEEAALILSALGGVETARALQDQTQANILDDIAGALWGEWDVINIPGAVCSDGSQYKIFVDKASTFWDWLLGYDKRLTIYMEPGGACWDYESCTGQSGIRGAANPNGIPDNHMSFADFLDPNKEGGSVNGAISPLILKNHPTGQNVETAKWNKVFIPYCTGDVYAGNKTAVYDDPTGQNPSITYHHKGAPNMEKVVDYLKNEFYRPKEMITTGCSAGGTGTLINYHFLRKNINPVKSYMLNDSGPIFSAPGSGNQYPLHEKIKDAWNTDYVVDKLISEMPQFAGHENDYGYLSEALAQQYPNDRLAITLFSRDANYSMYSYARFYGLDENDPADHEYILSTLWGGDIENMKTQYDQYSNLNYFIPWYRNMNESHCTAIVEFTGTEIGNTGYDLGDFVDDLLNEPGSLSSHFEGENASDANVSNFWMALVNLLL